MINFLYAACDCGYWYIIYYTETTNPTLLVLINKEGLQDLIKNSLTTVYLKNGVEVKNKLKELKSSEEWRLIHVKDLIGNKGYGSFSEYYKDKYGEGLTAILINNTKYVVWGIYKDVKSELPFRFVREKKRLIHTETTQVAEFFETWEDLYNNRTTEEIDYNTIDMLLIQSLY